LGHDTSTYASWIAGITGVHHHVSLNVLPELASNHHPFISAFQVAEILFYFILFLEARESSTFCS
jgi:hypothetical protein